MKALLSTMVCVKLNPEKTAEGSEVSVRNGKPGYPTYVVEDASGRTLGKVTGKSSAEQFVPLLVDAVWAEPSSLAGAEKKDWKAIATAIARTERLFAGTGPGTKAAERRAELRAEAAFLPAYAEARQALDAAMATGLSDAAKTARTEADAAERKALLDSASQASKKNRRPEAIGIWKEILAVWPDTPEAKTSRDRLKFFGVKVDPPAK